MSINVLIADDHPLVRVGLRFSLERSDRDIAIVAEASTGSEVLRFAAELPINVFILDISMPGLNGLEAARALKQRRPGAPIIILSFHNTRVMLEEAIAAGASGYLTKEAAGRAVVDAVCTVHAGKFFLSPDLIHLRSESAGTRRAASRELPVLTLRERHVLQLIASGRTSKEIAGELGRTIETVRSHRKNLMAKLGVHKQTDLVRMAIRAGVTSL